MEWLEANPLPAECCDCHEEDCYNCDTAGRRWYLSEKDELQLRRESLLNAIERLQKRVSEIDNRLEQIEQEADEPNVLMTQEMWEECLFACTMAGDIEQYNKLWNEYPDLVENMMREFDEVAARNPIHTTEEEKQASWERFVARMRKEYGEDFI